MDVQKERIRQKICDAVVQIWRKETGSTVPLCIEGTICVTPWHGRTSAFHTSMQIPGVYLLPEEVDEALYKNARKRRRLDSLTASECLVDLGCTEEEADLSSEAGEEASGSSVSKSPPSARDDNNNQSGIVDAETDLEVFVKEEPCATDDSENNLDEDSVNGDLSEDGVESAAANVGPICPGTGYYTCSREDVQASTEGETAENRSSSNVDSGVQDLSSTEVNHDESPTTSHLQDSVVTHSQKNESPESEGDRATPTPLVVDLSQSSQQTSSQQTSSRTNHAAAVQTAIRNMLSIKQAASSNNKTSGDNGFAVSVQKPLLSAKNGVTPEFVLSKSISVTPILKTARLVGISTSASNNLPRHSTPISLSYSFNGKVIEKPLHSLLGLTTSGSPSSTVSAYIVSPKLEMPTAAISLPVVHVANSSADSVCLDLSSTESTRIGAEQKTYSCKHCHKKFLFKSKYQEHMPVHTSDRPFQCTSCQRTYKYKYDLNVHLRTHQGIPTKSTICPFCTKKFQTNKMLRLHITEDHKDQQEGMKGKLPSDENSNHSSAVVQDNSQDLQEAT